MKRATKILLDLDDVLSDCTMSALKYLGCTDPKFDPGWGYDILRAVNELQPKEFTADMLWSRLDIDFWSNMPKSRECDWLLDVAAGLVGSKNVCVLSSATYPAAMIGKLKWMEKNLPDWMQGQYLFGSHKEFCAAPNHLLIDDNDANVDNFRDAGGQAILVPRPWNHKYRVPTMIHLINELGGYVKFKYTNTTIKPAKDTWTVDIYDLFERLLNAGSIERNILFRQISKHEDFNARYIIDVAFETYAKTCQEQCLLIAVSFLEGLGDQAYPALRKLAESGRDTELFDKLIALARKTY